MARTDDSDRPPARRRRARRLWLAAIGMLVVVAALVSFQPWKLVVDEVVDEALPAAAAVTSSTTSPSSAAPGTTAPTVGAPEPPRVLARGTLISHEHTTSGTVLVLALADGRRVLRLQDLRTSNGPDVKVWLSDATVRPGADGWRVFDDGRYADLGSLKGNVGNQNYVVPDDVDLDSLTSLSLWCDRFDVSFGAATLAPA
jgi:hypothetical protein